MSTLDTDLNPSGQSESRVPVASLVNAATLALMCAAVLLRDGGGPAHPGAPLLVFTALQWLPLLTRNRWPLPALAATSVASLAQIVLLPHLDAGWETDVDMAAYQPVPIAVAVAAYTVATRTPPRRAWAAVLTASTVLPLVASIARSSDHLWTDVVMANLILDGAAVGAIVVARRDRLAREEREQQERTRREVEAERLRIARELHDVLAHHLTLVNAQAGVARYLLRSDLDAAEEALEGMSVHTRQALDEVRATVGLLRRNDDEDSESPYDKTPPLPTLAQLPQLIDSLDRAGVTVEQRVTGAARPLSPGVDLAAYRVIQEALTNATKHAPGMPITIEVGWQHEDLQVAVRNPVNTTANDGPGQPDQHRPHRSGHGLLGMAERVRAAGGHLDVRRPGPEHPARFSVTATLPAEPAQDRHQAQATARQRTGGSA